VAERFSAVAFDFDYTLADSSEGVVACVGYALHEMGLPSADEQSIRRSIGLSLEETMVRLVGAQHAHRADEFNRLFVEHADRVMVDMTVIYPSVPRVMSALRERGLAVGIVSTKYRYRIEWTLQRHGLRGLFDVIVGGEDVKRHKPDPESLLMAVRLLGSTPESTLYVGDSRVDAEAAARAGIPFAWVRSGATESRELSGYRLYAELVDVADLPGIL